MKPYENVGAGLLISGDSELKEYNAVQYGIFEFHDLSAWNSYKKKKFIYIQCVPKVFKLSILKFTL